jgi:hypothetical protein
MLFSIFSHFLPCKIVISHAVHHDMGKGGLKRNFKFDSRAQ